MYVCVDVIRTWAGGWLVVWVCGCVRECVHVCAFMMGVKVVWQ